MAYSVVYELPGELVLYVRESNVYTSGPYYLATVLALVIIRNVRWKSSTFVTLRFFHFFSGDSSDTQDGIQGAFIHGCPVFRAAF